jgi:hypothetical protein
MCECVCRGGRRGGRKGGFDLQLLFRKLLLRLEGRGKAIFLAAELRRLSREPLLGRDKDVLLSGEGRDLVALSPERRL